MKAFALILAVVSVVAADVSHLKGSGYHYDVPHTSYGVPAHQPSGGHYSTSAQYSSGHYSTGNQHAQPVHDYVSSGHQVHYNTGNNYNNAAASSGYQNQYQTLNSGHVQSHSQPSYQAVSSGHHGQAYNNYQASNQFNSAVVQKYQEVYNQVQQPAQVFKHFYVHAAPEEPEQPKFRQPVVLPPPQKHYKIIFIKTPAPPAPAPQYIPVHPQTEEKTIVYVLVKKPEESPEVVVPKIEQKPPSKPEVFFIKYNNKEDSQAVINNIVSNHNQGQSAGSVSYAGADSQDSSAVLSTGNSHVVHDQSQIAGLSSDVVSGGHGFGVSSVSAEATSGGVASSGIGGYTGLSSVNDVTQGSYSTGEVQHQGNYQSHSQQEISTSQGVPHESYGQPNFHSH